MRFLFCVFRAIYLHVAQLGILRGSFPRDSDHPKNRIGSIEIDVVFRTTTKQIRYFVLRVKHSLLAWGQQDNNDGRSSSSWHPPSAFSIGILHRHPPSASSITRKQKVSFSIARRSGSASSSFWLFQQHLTHSPSRILTITPYCCAIIFLLVPPGRSLAHYYRSAAHGQTANDDDDDGSSRRRRTRRTH
jgi:hypothetical protein